MTIEEKIDNLIGRANKAYRDSEGDAQYIKIIEGKKFIIVEEAIEDWPDDLGDKAHQRRLDKLKSLIEKGLQSDKSEILITSNDIQGPAEILKK